MKPNPTTAARTRRTAAALTVVVDAPVTPTRAMDTTSPTLTSPTLTQGMKTVINSTEDFVAFGKGNLEAFAAAGKIWAAGLQNLTQQVAATAKASVEESVETFKALTAVKSVKEAIDLQTTYSKSVSAKALAESTRLTEASIKLTEQALAPLTARMAVAVEAFSKAA
jgi:phasin family protein